MIEREDSLLAINEHNTPDSEDDTPNFYAGTAEFEGSVADWGFKPEKGGCAPYVELTPERKAELIQYYTEKYPERNK